MSAAAAAVAGWRIGQHLDLVGYRDLRIWSGYRVTGQRSGVHFGGVLGIGWMALGTVMGWESG